MSFLLSLQRTIAFKEESTEGTAETSFSSSDAPVKVYEASGSPEQEVQEREPFSQSLGYDPDIVGVRSYTISFETDLIGSGDHTSTAPPFDLLLKACGYERLALTAVPIGAVTSGPFVIGEAVTDGATTTGIVAKTTYTGESVLYIHTPGGGTFSNADSLEVSGGASATASDDASVVGYIYKPVTNDSDFPSLTFRDYMSGKLDVAVGCRGNMTLRGSSNEAVRLAFEFRGKDGDDSDVAQLADSAPSTVPPTLKNAQLKTYLDSGTAYLPSFESLELSTGNEINLVKNANDTTGAGYDYAFIGQRQGAGSLDVLATTVATHPWRNLVSTAGTGVIEFTVGTAAGQKFIIQAPNAQYVALNPGVRERRTNYSLDLKINRLNGDDELVILAV